MTLAFLTQQIRFDWVSSQLTESRIYFVPSMPISSRRSLASLHSLEHLAVLDMGYDDNDALALACLLNLRVRQEPRATEEIVHVSKFQFSFGDNNVFPGDVAIAETIQSSFNKAQGAQSDDIKTVLQEL